jgi:hypothetical protein
MSLFLYRYTLIRHLPFIQQIRIRNTVLRLKTKNRDESLSAYPDPKSSFIQQIRVIRNTALSLKTKNTDESLSLYPDPQSSYYPADSSHP